MNRSLAWLAGRAAALGAPGGSCGWVEPHGAGRCASFALARLQPGPSRVWPLVSRAGRQQGRAPAEPSSATATRLAGQRVNRQRVAAEGNLSVHQLSDLFAVAPLDPDRERLAASGAVAVRCQQRQCLLTSQLADRLLPQLAAPS